MSTAILGISAFYHDSAACLLVDGEIIAAAEEERFSRKKGDSRFPKASVDYCLSEAGLKYSDLQAVAFYDKPVLTFARLLQTYLEFPLQSLRSFNRSMPVWLKEKLSIPKIIDENLEGFGGEIFFSKHHESHAASAFFCSPFKEAALVIADGVGEWATSSIGEGRDNQIKLLKETRFPHSIGLLYTAVTQYLGFKVNFDEYKVMGLAPYGSPVYRDLILQNVIDLKEDGSFALNLDYFQYTYGLQMISDKFPKLFGQEIRRPESKLEQFHMDIAASVQSITAETVFRMAKTAREITGHKKLCLAGGVALNCVSNGNIYRSGLFEDIYVQPAAGDGGGAIGAAYQIWHQVMLRPRASELSDKMKGSYLGPEIKANEVREFLDRRQVQYQELEESELPSEIARWIAAGHVIGFCNGRMEFGPRALGARSILGDPRDPETQSRINLKVKYRESFRPFAPAILEERVKDYFDIDIPSPYMLIVMPVKAEKCMGQEEMKEKVGLEKLKVQRSDVPAITHVDYSVRLQTLSPGRNPVFHGIVSEFYKLTGCPLVVNTSFNVRGEPIVCDHEDAYRCFLMTDLDILVLDRCVVKKQGVDLSLPARIFKEKVAVKA